jgi:hypothetical protein
MTTGRANAISHNAKGIIEKRDESDKNIYLVFCIAKSHVKGA